MYVRTVHLSNIKGFSGRRRVRSLELPPNGGWTVLAGRNGSGKTTLLQAIALALGGPAVARSLVADFTGWISMPGSRTGWVAVEVLRNAAEDRFIRRGRAPGDPLELGLRWSRPSSEPGGERPSMEAFGFDSGSASGNRGPWAENPRGWFCAGYGPFRRLVGGSSEAQRLMLASGPVGRLATLFHEDASLSEGVAWLVDLHLRRLEERPGAGALLTTVQRLLSDGLLPEGFEVAEVNSEGLWVRARGAEEALPLRAMSDGYRTVAALVLDLVRQIHAAYGDLSVQATDDGVAIGAPGVVLIDELDAHLHVTWQRVIGDWMRRHFPNIQFIVSSHSPYICQAADPNGLIRLPGSGRTGRRGWWTKTSTGGSSTAAATMRRSRSCSAWTARIPTGPSEAGSVWSRSSARCMRTRRRPSKSPSTKACSTS